MSSRTSLSDVSRSARSFANRFFTPPWKARQLVVIASALHLLLAVAIFVAGRAQIAAPVVDRDGIIGSFAVDSYKYQRSAVQLAGLLRSGAFANWATADQPMHAKIIALPFALLGPLFGYGTLSAEPYNLICYAAVVALAFALGRELYSPRAGLFAAAAIAVWPTFLMHTTQLLKDPLFVAASLVFLWCVTTWLTRTYNPMRAAAAAALSLLMLLLLLLVRSNVVVVIVAVGSLGLALLMLRQLLERRLLLWNMISAAPVLLTALLLMPFLSTHARTVVKKVPAAQPGQAKLVADTSAQLPSLTVQLPARARLGGSDSTAVRWRASADRAARRISSMRSRFAAAYSDSGSLLDGSKEFRSGGDLVAYLPRAVAIGLWAPFPNSWVRSGRRIGSAGKSLAAAETFLIYLCQLLALVAVMREPRRLAFWFVLAIATAGVTALAFVVPNAGALYRFRYTFWILIVIVAMAGVDRALNARIRRHQRRQTGVAGGDQLPQLHTKTMGGLNCLALLSTLAGTLAICAACQSLSRPGGTHLARPQTLAGSNEVRAQQNVSLTNFTGASLRRLYLSPSSASGWEENVLEEGELKDGDTIEIRVEAAETPGPWDVRIGGVEHYAEWKDLKLGDGAEITVLLRPGTQPTVVAEVESY
jgi:hypothetical protein